MKESLRAVSDQHFLEPQSFEDRRTYDKVVRIENFRSRGEQSVLTSTECRLLSRTWAFRAAQTSAAD
jgi:hypothetical protein